MPNKEESVEDELSFNRSAFATPSIDPLDNLIATMEAKRSQQGEEAQETEEQEPEKDEATSTTTTADDEPDDDLLGDDDAAAEANTPDDDDKEQDEKSQESQQPPRSGKSSKSEDEAQDATSRTPEKDSDHDVTQLSRSQRGKLITELREQLEKEQEAKRQLEESLKAQREADEALAKEVDRALGTDEQMEKDLQAGLQGDEQAAKRYQVYKSNREFYQKLVAKASQDNMTTFMSQYWKDVAELPGVTQDSLRAPQLSDILKNMYEAGKNSVTDASSDEIEKLQAEISTWKGRYKKLKIQAGGSKQSPLGGGGSTASPTAFDWRKKYIIDGVLTDEAEAIVDRYGFAALADPKLRKG